MNSLNDFTPRAQQVLALARKEADRLGSSRLGPEHLLLGIAKLDNGVAKDLLWKFEISTEALRQAVEDKIGVGAPRGKTSTIKYTPRCKKCLALASKEAKRAAFSHVDSAHILLGILAEKQNVGAHILGALGMELTAARDWVARQSAKETIRPSHSAAGHSVPTAMNDGMDFTIWIDPGASSAEDVAELFSAISGLCKIFNGPKLTFVRDDKASPVVMEATS